MTDYQLFTYNFQSFPYLMEVMDLSGIFFIASICSILGAAFSLVFIPETRNKSISELENLFVRHVKPSVQTKAWINTRPQDGKVISLVNQYHFIQFSSYGYSVTKFCKTSEILIYFSLDKVVTWLSYNCLIIIFFYKKKINDDLMKQSNE